MKSEAKEAIVLDRDGTPIAGVGATPRLRTFSLGPWVGGAAALFLVFAGMTFFGIFVAVFLGFWLLRSILRLFGLAQPGSSRIAVYSIRRPY